MNTTVIGKGSEVERPFEKFKRKHPRTHVLQSLASVAFRGHDTTTADEKTPILVGQFPSHTHQNDNGWCSL